MLFRYASLTRWLLAILGAAALMSPAAAATVKLPQDMPAPRDPLAMVSRALAVAPIDNSAGKYVAVGPWGRILVTADAGKNWTQVAVPVSSDLVAAHFPTPGQGWAVGHDGIILHSTDGGKTWKKVLDGRDYGDIMVRYYEARLQAIDAARDSEQYAKFERALKNASRFKEDGPDKPFLDVWFENEQSGWVVGAFNLILKTEDGGKTWIPWIDRTDNQYAYSLYAIRNAGDEVFLVGELGLVRRLDRATNTFVMVETPNPGSFFGLAGKPGLVVLFGLRGVALRSRDAGKTWETLKTGVSRAVTGGTFLDDGRLVLTSSDGQLLVSNDDGDHFAEVSLRRPMSLNDVIGTAGDEVIVVGERGVSAETLK